MRWTCKSPSFQSLKSLLLLSSSCIKNTSIRFAKATIGMANKVYACMRSEFACYIYSGISAVVKTAWAIFTFTLAYLYFTQGLSLYLEQKSGTMTIHFQSEWLVMAVNLFIIVLIGGSLILAVNAILKFRKMHNKLSAPTKDVIDVKLLDKRMNSLESRLENIEKVLQAGKDGT